jgi:hypothetical protein
LRLCFVFVDRGRGGDILVGWVSEFGLLFLVWEAGSLRSDLLGKVLVLRSHGVTLLIISAEYMELISR